MERGSWDDLRKRKNTDEIQMFTIAKKVDEAFQVPENKAYACREKHEMIQAEALEREMEDFRTISTSWSRARTALAPKRISLKRSQM